MQRGERSVEAAEDLLGEDQRPSSVDDGGEPAAAGSCCPSRACRRAAAFLPLATCRDAAFDSAVVRAIGFS